MPFPYSPDNLYAFLHTFPIKCLSRINQPPFSYIPLSYAFLHENHTFPIKFLSRINHLVSYYLYLQDENQPFPLNSFPVLTTSSHILSILIPNPTSFINFLHRDDSFIIQLPPSLQQLHHPTATIKPNLVSIALFESRSHRVVPFG
jgi:hypothetical protein